MNEFKLKLLSREITIKKIDKFEFSKINSCFDSKNNVLSIVKDEGDNFELIFRGLFGIYTLMTGQGKRRFSIQSAGKIFYLFDKQLEIENGQDIISKLKDFGNESINEYSRNYLLKKLKEMKNKDKK